MLAEISLTISTLIFIAFNIALHFERKQNTKHFADLRAKLDKKTLRAWAFLLNFKEELQKMTFLCKLRFLALRLFAFFLHSLKRLAGFLDSKSRHALEKIEKAEVSQHLQDIKRDKTEEEE